MSTVTDLGRRGKAASYRLANLSTTEKNTALAAISASLIEHKTQIIAANLADCKAAEAQGLSPSLLDRLVLDEERIQGIAKAARQIAALEDPVGKVISGKTLPNGIELICKTVPFGLIGVIYESRPNVTADIAALCLKSGNACLLRGGKEALASNRAIVGAIHHALVPLGLGDAVLLLEDTSRAAAEEMMELTAYLSLLIPRGGAGLIKTVVEKATVPVIQTGVGNCHLYVEKTADLAMAVAILENGKTSRTGVCNALESLLVDEAIAPAFLPLAAACLQAHGVEMRGCQTTCRLLEQPITPATDDDYRREFLGHTIAIRVVPSIAEAIDHIRLYSTGHSEAIVTTSLCASETFTHEVDSAVVYVNASTRFTDGGAFGLGAEIGISTQKLHVRGPMGLSHLVSTKYILTGNGQVR